MKKIITQKELLDKGFEVFKYAGTFLFVGKAEIYIDKGDDDIIKFHDGQKYLRFIVSQKDLTFFYKGDLDMLRIADDTKFDMRIVSERLDLEQQELLGLLTQIMIDTSSMRDVVSHMYRENQICCAKTNENLEKIVTKLDNLKVEPPKEEEPIEPEKPKEEEPVEPEKPKDEEPIEPEPPKEEEPKYPNVSFMRGDLVTSITDGKKVGINISCSEGVMGMLRIGDFAVDLYNELEKSIEYPLFGTVRIAFDNMMYSSNDSITLTLSPPVDDGVLIDEENKVYSFSPEPKVLDIVNSVTIPDALRVVSRDDSRKALVGTLSLRSVFDAWGLDNIEYFNNNDVDIELVSFDYVFDTPPTTSIGTIFSQTRWRNEEIMMVKELGAHLSSLDVPRMVRMDLRLRISGAFIWTTNKEVVLEVEKSLL